MDDLTHDTSVVWNSKRISLDAECRTGDHFMVILVPDEDAGTIAIQ